MYVYVPKGNVSLFYNVSVKHIYMLYITSNAVCDRNIDVW